jgi:hypothetical protein
MGSEISQKAPDMTPLDELKAPNSEPVNKPEELSEIRLIGGDGVRRQAPHDG